MDVDELYFINGGCGPTGGNGGGGSQGGPSGIPDSQTTSSKEEKKDPYNFGDWSQKNKNGLDLRNENGNQFIGFTIYL